MFGTYPDNLAHQHAAYDWGYKVADPEAIRQARTIVENIQAIGFTVVDGAVVIGTLGKKNYTYQPLGEATPGGFSDSAQDVGISVNGAEDAAAGKPASPPTQ